MPRWAELAAVLTLVALVAGLFVMQPWSGNAQPPAPAPRAREGFASDRTGPGQAVDFDANRAMEYLQAICKIGPRISGTEGMKKQQELLANHFKSHGATVCYQRFTATPRSIPREAEMANLIVSWHPARSRRVILCSHYDTRPIADQEPDARRWRDPFVSANDGGSGIALLMELAHHMNKLPTDVGVDFVFFDGEEYIFDREVDEYFLGSRHFGRQYRKDHGSYRYIAAILLDMVGGKDAHFPIEQTSWNQAPGLVREVWTLAGQLGCTAFDSNAFSRFAIQDDHVALNQAGIPAIDIIDFDYKHWHRLSDLPENCSGASLEQVARVLSVWLQRVK